MFGLIVSGRLVSKISSLPELVELNTNDVQLCFRKTTYKRKTIISSFRTVAWIPLFNCRLLVMVVASCVRSCIESFEKMD